MPVLRRGDRGSNAHVRLVSKRRPANLARAALGCGTRTAIHLGMGNIANRVKGKLKEIEGRVTGDKVRETEGAVQNGVGKVGSAVKRGVNKLKLKALKTKAGRKAAAAKYTP